MTLAIVLLLAAFSAASTDNVTQSPTHSLYECNNKDEVHQMHLFPGLMTELKFPGLNLSQPTISSRQSSHNFLSFAMQYNPEGYPHIALYGKEVSTFIICLRNGREKTEYELNITLNYCPAGFTSSSLGMCLCNRNIISTNIWCDQVLYTSGVFVGFCASRKNGKSPLLIARCGYANKLIKPVFPIPQNSLTGKTTFCDYFNRTGKLCSRCQNGLGISVFSDTFDCIPCRDLRAGTLITYLAIELLPTTVFFMAILLFHIGITTGPANGFIFFAQMITTPLEVLFLTYGLRLYIPGNKFFSTGLADLVIDPYCIWNLNFFRIFHQDICLHQSMKVVHVLALHYISAIYPLFLLVITYLVIELQARNVRLVTCLWRLLCFPCVRWRRVWKAKTSVIDAFASCILLSYTKFVLVSLTYFSHSNVQDASGKTVEKVLSFDTSIPFLGKEHKPFVAISIIVLLTFGVFPPLILTCYQFRPFQNCLDFLRLRRQGLQRFVEAFQGCYKDGTDGKVDCRFFAGLYFIFRDIILIVNAVSTDFPSGFTMIIIATMLFLLLFAVFQPYRKSIYNMVDALFVFLFAVVTTLQMYIYDQFKQTLKISHLFLMYYLLLLIPLIYMKAFVTHWLYRRWQQRHNHLRTPVPRDHDFFRESLMEERRMNDDEARVNFSRQQVTQSEVSVTRLSDSESGEGRGRGDSNDWEGRCKEEERERGVRERGAEWSDEEVREKPCSERDNLVQHELEPVMHYGTM